MSAAPASNSASPVNHSFRERVLSVVRAIPKGSVMTYGQVAAAAGTPGAARAVGSLMAKNFDPSVPCHRVIRGDGTIGRYNRGNENKPKLLAAEGVSVSTKGAISKVAFA